MPCIQTCTFFHPYHALLALIVFHLCFSSLASSEVDEDHRHCIKNPVIFNFGDSNSDTGGLSAVTGFIFGYPNARTFFHQPTGRTSDGRLIIDFLCDSLTKPYYSKYLTPYLDSMEPDFSNGVNFAIGGATTLPRYVPFRLGIQVLQLIRFHNRALLLRSKGFKNLPAQEDFNDALYTIDIGQNDLSGGFSYLSYDQVIENIPSFIAEIRDAMWSIYKVGGRKFWVHNTGPLGCLPDKLAAYTRKKSNTDDFDQYGCIKSINEGAKIFNARLNALCGDLRLQMKNSIIVYVDIYSIKYDLIASAASYGFKNPLMACCGHGGPPYNIDPNVTCGAQGFTVCEPESPHVSWDGVHYTDAANAIVASKILSSNYCTPPLKFNFFCN